MNKDPYEVLGVTRNCSLDDIQKAYREKAKKYHPDRNIGDPDSEQKFLQIQDAYDVLNDPVKKSNYDRFGNHNNDIFTGFMHTMYDIFGKSVHKGRNIQAKINITLEEVAKGCIKKVKISKSKICKTCQGSGGSKSEKCKRCDGSGVQNVGIQIGRAHV